MDSPRSTAQTEATSQAMMNEEEAKLIISNYQITIRQISKEIDILLPRHAQLKERSGNLMAQVMQYSQDLEKFKVLEVYLAEQIPILKKLVEEEIEFLQSEVSNIQNLDEEFNFDQLNIQDQQKQQQQQEGIQQNIQVLDDNKNQEEQKQNTELLDLENEQNVQQDDQESEIDLFDEQPIQKNNNNLQQQQNQKGNDNKQAQSLVLDNINKYNKDKRLSVQSLSNVQKRQSFIQKRNSLIIQLQENKQFDEKLIQINEKDQLYQEFFGENQQNLEFIQNLNNNIEKYKQENEKLEEQKNKKIDESLKLAHQLRQDDLSNMEIKFCINCNEEYSPFTNTEESCVYHIGQMKFYSCQTCGKDDYYNCCNQCILCNKGCQTKKHISTL